MVSPITYVINYDDLRTVTFSMCMGQKYLIRQQWDFPNVWPPLVEITVRTNLFTFFSKSMSHFQVVSLEKTNSTVGRNMAKTIANNFLNNVLRSIQFSFGWVMELLTCRSEERSGNIFEKYNCTGAGRPGGGGEYDVQVNGGSSLISLTKTFAKDDQCDQKHCRKVLGGQTEWLSVFWQGIVALGKFIFIFSCPEQLNR